MSRSQKVDDILDFINDMDLSRKEAVELIAVALGVYLAGGDNTHYLNVDGIIRDAYITTMLEM